MVFDFSIALLLLILLKKELEPDIQIYHRKHRPDPYNKDGDVKQDREHYKANEPDAKLISRIAR